MQAYRHEFIDYAIHCGVLRFGSFVLKSGRVSPYFFNTGLFNTGERLGRLGDFYAQAYQSAKIKADVLYGPAYKGIALVCATAIALAGRESAAIPFAFNRKEAKDHGEGGILVGAPLVGDVLIVDDVITAGTSVRESFALITAAQAKPVGVLIALDRMERGEAARSAVQEVQAHFGIPVHSIADLSDIQSYLAYLGRAEELDAIRAYRSQYGISADGD